MFMWDMWVEKYDRRSTNKIENFESFPRPETMREVRGFLSLTGYHRRYIPDYATIASTLTDFDVAKRATEERGVHKGFRNT